METGINGFETTSRRCSQKKQVIIESQALGHTHTSVNDSQLQRPNRYHRTVISGEENETQNCKKTTRVKLYLSKGKKKEKIQ